MSEKHCIPDDYLPVPAWPQGMSHEEMMRIAKLHAQGFPKKKEENNEGAIGQNR